MKPNPIAIAIAVLAILTGTAFAQTTTPDPAASAGVLPPAPAVQAPPTPNVDSEVGGSPGFFRPSPEAVVVPPFTPATPGVTPIDTPTNATVGASPSDTSLRDNLASAIAADPGLQGARINVLVRDGVVTLSGTAQDAAQASRARAMAERMVGSARVSANISSPG